MKKITLIIIASCFTHSAFAALKTSYWDRINVFGSYGLMGASVVKPITVFDWTGLKQAGFSIGNATSVSLLTQALIDEPRPDGSGMDSFPSLTTANAFASASSLYIRYGWEIGFPALGIATLVGYAGVEADKHDMTDVLAGAVVGAVSGWLMTDTQNRRVKLMPWASSNEFGLSFQYDW